MPHHPTFSHAGWTTWGYALHSWCCEHGTTAKVRQIILFLISFYIICWYTRQYFRNHLQQHRLNEQFLWSKRRNAVQLYKWLTTLQEWPSPQFVWCNDLCLLWSGSGITMDPFISLCLTGHVMGRTMLHFIGSLAVLHNLLSSFRLVALIAPPASSCTIPEISVDKLDLNDKANVWDSAPWYIGNARYMFKLQVHY